MRAAMWWIDRWRQSDAYARMTAEEQGLYRNLCDEVVLRESGVIPDDQRILAKASGDHEAWARSGKSVLKSMKKVSEGWTNETAMSVKNESERRSRKQREYRNGLGNSPGNGAGNAPDNEPRPQEQDKETYNGNGKNGVARTRDSIHDACNRLTEGNPDIPAIDRLDEDIAFEESRFNSLALSIGRDRIQSVLDSLPRPKSVGAFSASRWLATGRSGIGRDERAMTRLKLTNDGLEAWKREVESPSGRKKGPAPAWDRGIAHDVPDEVILAWDPRLGPKPDSLREPAITRQTQTQEMPS